jgi:hypothetical protein
MLTFYGHEIELFVEKVLDRNNGPVLCRARDGTAHQWLIVRVDADPEHLAWLCVPVSERAMAAVADGHAAPRDVIQHSATGAVDLVVVDHGRTIPDRCLLCSEIPTHLLPADDRPVLSAA